MDTRLDKNQTVLGIVVLTVALQVLADRHGTLDKSVQVLRELGSQTVGTQDTNDLGSSNGVDQRNTVGVTQNATDLRWSDTLTGKLADLLNNVLRGSLDPGRRSAAIRDSRLANTLSGSIHATHFSDKDSNLFLR